MRRFRHVLVHVTLGDPEVDRSTLRWAARVAAAARVEALTVAHAHEPIDLPPSALARYPWLQRPLGDQALEAWKAREGELGVAGLPSPALAFGPGPVLEHLLRLARDQGVDLLVAPLVAENRALAVRLARKAPCPVLLVPPGLPAEGPVMAATDGSAASREAIELAAAFGEGLGGGKLDVVLSYAVPREVAKSLLPQAELEADYERLARERLAEAVAGVNTHGITPRLLLERAPDAAAGILAAARIERASLVVCGCRGRHGLATTLLGGTTESLIERSDVPLLAVKAKGSTLSLLDVILGR